MPDKRRKSNPKKREPDLIINGVHYHHHPNGGGWVAETASVDESVWVGGLVFVHGKPRISENVVLLDMVEIDGSPTISGNAVLSNWTKVWGSPTICGNVRTYQHTRIFDKAVLEDYAILVQTSIFGKAYAGGECLIEYSKLTDTVVARGKQPHVSGKRLHIHRAFLYGNVRIQEEAQVLGDIYDLVYIGGNRVIGGREKIQSTTGAPRMMF